VLFKVFKLAFQAQGKGNIIRIHTSNKLTPAMHKTGIEGINHTIAMTRKKFKPGVALVERGNRGISTVVIDKQQFQVFK